MEFSHGPQVPVPKPGGKPHTSYIFKHGKFPRGHTFLCQGHLAIAYCWSLLATNVIMNHHSCWLMVVWELVAPETWWVILRTHQWLLIHSWCHWLLAELYPTRLSLCWTPWDGDGLRERETSNQFGSGVCSPCEGLICDIVVGDGVSYLHRERDIYNTYLYNLMGMKRPISTKTRTFAMVHDLYWC